MSEVSIPDFKSGDDFVAWAKNLDEKEIQAFTANDWVNFYRKLDAYVASSEDFHQIYQKNFDDMVDKGVFPKLSEEQLQNMTMQQLLDMQINQKRRLFVELDQFGDMICKLNRNYRFEPEQLKIIREMAHDAGTKLADTGVDAAKVAFPTKEGADNAVWDMAWNADDLTLKQTEYLQHNQWYPRSVIQVDKGNLNSNGVATLLDDKQRRISLNQKNAKDDIIRVAFHESAHAHLQTSSPLQIQLLLDGVTARPELGHDFHELMGWNFQYYVSPERAQRGITGDLYNIFSHSEVKSISKKAFNGYHKQPAERYSEIFGIEAERAFRKASGQKSERTVMLVANNLENTLLTNPVNGQVTKLGTPNEVFYRNDGTHLRYTFYDSELNNVALQSIKQRFVNADEALKKQLNIQSDVFGNIDVCVPTTYTFKRDFLNFVQASSSLPPIVDGNTVSDLPPLPQTADKKITQFQGMAAESMDKFEQKLGTKGGTHTVKLTTQQMAKKKGIIAKAAVANAKFDKAVDKVVDSGARVLNNTKVGKVYGKASQTVSKTATVKTVSKTVEKVTQKAVRTAVGKAVTKTIAKTAGSAVGKSVLKKIPLVSLGAGAWFAWDRIKGGDWKGACGELASGALGCFPGVGTAASTAIDVGLAAKDISQVMAENNQNQSSVHDEVKDALAKKAPKDLSRKIEARVNEENIAKPESTAVRKLTPIQRKLIQKQKQNSA